MGFTGFFHKGWIQVSAGLYASNSKKKSKETMIDSGQVGAGYGGHFRAVQGFRYLGELANK